MYSGTLCRGSRNYVFWETMEEELEFMYSGTLCIGRSRIMRF